MVSSNSQYRIDLGALFRGKVNACRFPAKAGGGAAKPVTVGLVSGDPDALAVKVCRGGGGDLQPKTEFAANSLQIAHWRLFDAIVDCAYTLSGGPRPGRGAGRPLFKPGASSGCTLSSV